MRYNHLDMLPARAFTKVGKRLATLEGGGGGKGDTPDYIPVTRAKATTGFGTAVANPETGTYKYTLDPRLASLRDVFYGGAQGFLPSQQELQFGKDVSAFGRDIYAQGGQYLQDAIGMSPQDAATSYYNRIQELQAPLRAAEESRLADTLFKTGRIGAATAYGGGGGYINPEQFGLMTARAQADKALGLEAEQYGRQLRAQDIASALGIQQAGVGNVQTGYGLGMMPYQSAAGVFGLGTDLEKLGLLPMQIAMQGLPYQMQVQQNQQAYENAKAAASGGKGFGGDLLGSALNMGTNYLASGGNPLASAGSLFSSLGSSSGSGGLTGVGNWLQYGGNVSPFAGAYSIDQNPYLNWRG